MKLTLGWCILVVNLALYSISCLADEKISVAVVKSAELDIYSAALEGFNEIIRDKKINVSLNPYYINASGDGVLNILQEIKVKNPAIVLTFGSSATKLISGAIKEIPIVFTMLLNPVELKLVKSMGPSGGNITGGCLDIHPKIQLELLKKILPKAVNVGVLYDPKYSKGIIEEARKLQLELKLSIIAVEISAVRDVPPALRNIGEKIDVLWLVPDTTVYTNDSLPFILQFCLDNKLPVMGFAEYLVKAGALFSYVYDYKDIGRQVGEIAVRVLSGELAGNISIAVPRKIGYMLNLLVAESLRIEISPKVIEEAQKALR